MANCLILRLRSTRFPIRKDRTNAPTTIARIKISNWYIPGWLAYGSVIDSPLRLYPLPVGVLDLFHLCNGMGSLYYLRRGVSPCQDEVHERRLDIY